MTQLARRDVLTGGATIAATRSVLALDKATEAAAGFARASKAASTLRAYRTDAADFTAWCQKHGLTPLPASVDTLASYLAELASSGMRASSITRRCAGLRYMHRVASFESPTNNEAIKAVLSGIKRSLGTAVTRKAPATAQAIRAMLNDIPTDLRGLRDRALLLLGFAAALRRSELVALNVDDIEENAEGILVIIRRSKTDQEGTGDFVSHPARLAPASRGSPQGVATGLWHHGGADLPSYPKGRSDAPSETHSWCSSLDSERAHRSFRV